MLYTDYNVNKKNDEVKIVYNISDLLSGNHVVGDIVYVYGDKLYFLKDNDSSNINNWVVISNLNNISDYKIETYVYYGRNVNSCFLNFNGIRRSSRDVNLRARSNGKLYLYPYVDNIYSDMNIKLYIGNRIIVEKIKDLDSYNIYTDELFSIYIPFNADVDIKEIAILVKYVYV